MEQWVNDTHIFINEKNLLRKTYFLNITIRNDFLIISKKVFDVKVV